MKPVVYLETSIISYLAARPSRDLVAAAWQEITREWWATRRDSFEPVVSALVFQEAGAGDPGAAARRAQYLRGLRILPVDDRAISLAERIARRAGLPPKAAADAMHIALAAVHGADYLLTWNCRHIASAVLRPRIESTCREFGAAPPLICTPDELLGD